MQPEKLNVFDFDGTIVRVNSFREITRRMVMMLLSRGRILRFLQVIALYLMRRCGFLSHLILKQGIVTLFEKSFSETQKKDLCQSVFDQYVNQSVYERLLTLENCLVSTAAPHAYISRISFGRPIPVISALDSTNCFPDKSNHGFGKAVNLKAYLKTDAVRIDCFFTDSLSEDQALAELAAQTFLVKEGKIERLK